MIQRYGLKLRKIKFTCGTLVLNFPTWQMDPAQIRESWKKGAVMHYFCPLLSLPGLLILLLRSISTFLVTDRVFAHNAPQDGDD